MKYKKVTPEGVTFFYDLANIVGATANIFYFCPISCDRRQIYFIFVQYRAIDGKYIIFLSNIAETTANITSN